MILRHCDPQTPSAAIGGKARSLASLGRAGLPVPEWFVILPKAFYLSLNAPQGTSFERASGPDEIAETLQSLSVAPEVRTQIRAEVDRMFEKRCLLAVRSSAHEEDGTKHSFAGQLDSFLFVPPEDVCAHVLRVWRSAYGPRVLAYRRERDLPLLGPAPAVLVQRMIDPRVSGAAFGADPVSGRRCVAVVNALWGVGSALVSGECEADTFKVNREGTILGRRIARKHTAHRRSPSRPGEVETVEVPPDRAQIPALVDEEIRRVAELVRLAGRHFGRPQDIEWAVEDRTLYLLQSRPITTLDGIADPDGEMNLWDNSNIAESYSGITTPLTFSFARYAYQEVYREFCRIMGVPEQAIAEHAETFRRMLGLLRGRVFYNLRSWYRVLSLLPGFTVNRKFMEQMMGVKAGIPERIAAELHTPTDLLSRLRDGTRLAGTLLSSLYNSWTLPRKIERFQRRLDEALRPPRPDWADMTIDELSRLYRDMEHRLLSHWDAPLINDFFAMIAYGLLKQLTQAWCGDPDSTLQNDLLCGEGGMISAEPARRMREMAEIARQHPEVAAILREESLDKIHDALKTLPELQRSSRKYLVKFGERCLEELKLETRTLNDDPLLLWRSIGHLAASSPETTIPSPTGGLETQIRRQAQERVAAALRGHPLRRLLFHWVLRQARRRVRDRENLRFERTRVFGQVRRIFVEIGRRLHALDILKSPRDIFYLTLEEIFGFMDGTAVTTNLKPLVALRKSEFDRYKTQPPPADRFETYGIVNHGNNFEAARAPQSENGTPVLKGLGCCPGVVRGRAHVISDPRHARINPGEILVASRTDPGWVMLFPSAAGLLVEYGSLLSHSAIVAREMGIPAVVSAAGATRWAQTGDWLELDGRTGIVRKISAP